MTERRLLLLPLDELVSAEVNPKRHDMETLDASLDRFGYVEPIVRDDRTGRLVSGHGRTASLLARRERGEPPPEGVEVDAAGRWLAPVLVGWSSKTDDDAAAAVVALNRIGERGGWEKDSLAALLADLADTELGLAGVGYDRADLDDLLASLQEGDDVAYNPDRQWGEGAHKDSTFDEFEQNYRNKQVRSIVFDYPLEEYQRIAAIAARARRALGVDSNAELFAALLDRWDAEAMIAEVSA